MKDKIQIGICCGADNLSQHYISFLIDSVENTISKNIDYEYLIGVNKNVDLSALDKYNIKIIKEYDSGLGSVGHGHCLNLLLKNMSSKYGMFLDQDVAFIKKNWDEDFISLLDEKNIIIGSSDHPKVNKQVGFPTFISCMFFVEKFQSFGIDMRPKFGHGAVKKKINEEDSMYFGIPAGTEIQFDTGCHVCKTVKQLGYDGICLEQVSPRYDDTISKLKFMLPGMRGEEYQLNGIPYTTHVGRSTSRDFFNDPIIIQWKNRVLEWNK